jgi:hypothetical protein
VRKPLSDQALQHVSALGERVRALEAELVEARAQLADAVDRFLPPTASPDEVRRFTDASGFSRVLVDAIREEQPHYWRRVR